MARRDRGGWDDYEMERRMEEAEDRQRHTGPYDDLLIMGFGAVVVIALIFGGLSWLDGQFGWGTVEWLKGLIGV